MHHPSDLKEVTKQIYRKYKQDQLNPPKGLLRGDKRTRLIAVIVLLVLVSIMWPFAMMTDESPKMMTEPPKMVSAGSQVRGLNTGRS